MRLPDDWRTAAPGPRMPTVDEVDFRALYQKTKYVVETADGWSLMMTRYRPVKQPFPQPLFGEVLLLVHGFSQNRHAWTSGQFVKNLLFFGGASPEVLGRLFPSPTYEMPDDVWFEISGVLQAPVAVLAARAHWLLLRRAVPRLGR